MNISNILILCLFIATHAWSQPKNDSVEFVIHAIDLSEDKHFFSTKNDEVIFQLFKLENEEVLDKPLVYRNLLFNHDDSVRTVAVPHGQLDLKEQYLLFLVEYDYLESPERRSAVYRLYQEEIRHLFDANNQLELDKYMGSDELLGYQVINFGQNEVKDITFKGIRNLEKYIYHITWKTCAYGKVE